MTTVRVWFTKTGEAAYISLLDLQRVMQRAFRRAQVPAWYTLGFNPHIYMTFAAPLALGQESLVESLDFKTEAPDDTDWPAVAQRLTACLPRGVEALRIVPVQMKAEAITAARYEVRYEAQHAAAAQRAFDAFAALPDAIVVKKGKHNTRREVDLKTLVQIEKAEICENGGFVVTMRLPAGSTLNINPMLLLQFLEERFGLSAAAGGILRTALLADGEKTFA